MIGKRGRKERALGGGNAQISGSRQTPTTAIVRLDCARTVASNRVFQVWPRLCESSLSTIVAFARLGATVAGAMMVGVIKACAAAGWPQPMCVLEGVRSARTRDKG